MNQKEVAGFRKLASIDAGSYGSIYLCLPDPARARLDRIPGLDRHDGPRYFALKKFKHSPEEKNCGVHFSALSEIRLLTAISHPNIVKCLQVVNKELDIYMVMDFLVSLDSVRAHPKFGEPERRELFRQLLSGVGFLHDQWLLHRDLKPQNVMLSREGQVKLVDFGFARRASSPKRQLTYKVCTRQFRAPQVDFGSSFYTDRMDVWSAGCILAYLYLGRPIFEAKQGQNDLDFLADIFALRGTPCEKTWPGCQKLPRFKRYSVVGPQKLSKVIEGLPSDAEQLLEQMLQIDPRRRPSVQQCLQMEFFRECGGDTCLRQICEEQYRGSLARLLERKE